MKFAGRIAVLLALLLTWLAVPAAGAKTVTASGGGVRAKLTFSINKKMRTVSNPKIQLTGTGGATYSGAVNQRYCGTGYCEVPGVTVANLDGHHDAIASIFTGGAHCCSIASVYWQDTRGDWQHSQYDFADPGYRLEDLDHNGDQEFVTADDRFAYLLTAYADSGMPIEVLSFVDGKFVDITGDVSSLVTRDAARWWTGYEKDHSGGQIGQLAPWAADEDTLGNQSTVAKTLSAQVAKDRITAKQAAKLQHYLKKFGYTQ